MKDSILATDTLRGILSCSSSYKLASYVTRILSYTGGSGARFLLCKYRNVIFLVKLVLYKKTNFKLFNTNNQKIYTSPVDAELSILQLFRKNIIARGYTPGIIELIYVNKCKNIKKIVPNKHKCNKIVINKEHETSPIERWLLAIFCMFEDLVDFGIAEDKFCYMVLERCSMTLYKYLTHYIMNPVNFSIFKSLLFQILYTLHIITTLYPKFRHNDMHLENVMLKFDESFVYSANKQKHLAYINKERIFLVPYFGIIAKIIDFNYASVPEENIINEIALEKNVAYSRATSDVAYLMNAIYETVTSNDIEDLFYILDPSESYLYRYPAYLRQLAKENPSPSVHEMIDNKEAWKEYIINRAEYEKLDQKSIHSQYEFII